MVTSLSDEQRMLVESVRSLAEAEFSENACDWDGEYPFENLETLADHGFLGINLGEEYGGGGMTEFEALLLIDAVGRYCPDTAGALFNSQLIAPRTIEMFGSEAAKDRFLPPVTAGEDSIAIAISEPEAGSDVASMKTTVREADDGLVLTGEKIWVSHVPYSSAAVVWTKFEGEGLGTVILEFDQPGVEVVEHFTNMAGEPQSHFFMDGVRIPEEHVLTRGKDAFKEQLEALNWERLGSAALSNAIAWYALESALEYGLDREQFGQPLLEFQGLEWKLADMYKELEASRAVTYRAGSRAVERGRVPHRLETSLAKLYASEMVEHVVSEALQIHGAAAYQRDHDLEYLYRYARGRRLGGGTDEIQKNTVARALKRDGLPSIT